MAEIMIKGLWWVLDLGIIAVVFAIPCLYVYHKGRLFRGVLYSWMNQIILTILISLLIPELLAYCFPVHKDAIYENCPDARGIVGALLMGWLPALVFCGIAKLVYKKRKKTIARQPLQSESKGSQRSG
jgi:hypothetical protein